MNCCHRVYRLLLVRSLFVGSTLDDGAVVSDSGIDDYDGTGTRALDVGKILKGDGWDEIGKGNIYADVNLEDDDIDVANNDLSTSDSCTCSPEKIYDAAAALVKFFIEHPERIPRTEKALESFNTPVQHLYGPWTRYVNVAGSNPLDHYGDASIHLFGCSQSGHNFRVVIDDDHVPVIKGQKTAGITEDHLPSKQDVNVNADDDDDDWEDEDLMKAVETEEERRYDERNFGDLNPEVESPGDDEDVDLVKEWQELTFPSVAVNGYVENGLELEEVLQLGRYMPHDETLQWAEEFKDESMVALEFLRIGLGNTSHFKVLEGINYEELRSSIATEIRLAISRQFEKYQNQILIIDDEEKKDEQFDDEDLDWDDDDADE